MPKFDAPKNANYAAQIIRVHTIIDLPGLDNLVGVPALGHQALTTKGVLPGELRVAFTAETQLSDEYAYENRLYRDKTLNKGYNAHSWEGESGYLEKNRRIRAIKMRGHKSNCLLMPLDSLAYTGVMPHELNEGDTFDTLNGHEVCRKYQVPVKQQHGPKTKVERAFRRVDEKLFPEHLETDNYWRNKHLLNLANEVVVTQKLHGTSWRGANVPCLRQKKWHEKLLNRLIKTPDYEYDTLYGSRKVIKDPKNVNQNHFYKKDIWTDYGLGYVNGIIPEGYIVYGELVGWTEDGQPLQKNYTYHLPKGECELYVYRVAFINGQGVLSDLPWDGVKEWCRARGLKWVPELFRFSGFGPTGLDPEFLDGQVETLMDERYNDLHHNHNHAVDEPLPLSDKKSVDEGVCLRQEGIVPLILKAKSPKFLEHETKLLDADEVDMESAA